MIKITLPDKNVISFEMPVNGFEIAKKISNSLVKQCIAMEKDGILVDLATQIEKDCSIKLITTKDKIALDILRHSTAHVMAQAVLNLYKNVKFAIGPVIEDGFYYDFDMEPISEDELSKIEKEMKKIIKQRLKFERRDIAKDNANKLFENEPYKLELINELNDDNISIYQQGNFTDLCRGPHIPNTGSVKAFKLTKVSGAYWRADQNKAQLQRIYGTAFFNKEELADYLHVIEEAKKRDHRKLGTELELFSFHKEAPGMPFFHAKGMEIWNLLLKYWRYEHKRAGYVETKTPIMLEKSLWEQSGHWDHYRENMYLSVVDDFEYAIKPMNCPGGMLLYKTKNHSYRDLPIRAGEIGLVHRHELSGVLSGLFRVRVFHQDDAHIFMMPDQIEDEILGVLNLTERIYSTFGLSFDLELSTRPEKSIGSDDQWEIATKGLENALKRYGKDYKLNVADGAFYGPKIDVHIKDALGRTWQCGTVQLDMSLPERFNLSYIGKDNEKHRPIMIHRVIYGSIERFFGILIEHFAGKFPLWLAPIQIVLLPINDDLVSYANQIKTMLEKKGLRLDVDMRTESLGRKIRDAQLNKIPLILTIGNKEKETKTLSVRTLDGKVRQGLSNQEFLDKVLASVEKRSMGYDIF